MITCENPQVATEYLQMSLNVALRWVPLGYHHHLNQNTIIVIPEYHHDHQFRALA